MITFFRNIFSCIILFCGREVVFAQPFPDLRFQSLTEKDGLSNNVANYITQDKQGFIWIATDNGLNRFDGYRFKKIFTLEGDSTSIPDNAISNITIDSKNNLWLSTHNGMACFNPVTQQCISFKHHKGEDAVLEKYELPSIYIDTADNAWATTYDGLYQFDRNFYYHKTDNNRIDGFQRFEQYCDHYRYISRDKNGQLWANIFNHLCMLDNKTMKPIKTFIAPFEMNITHFYFDSENRCWLSTWGSGLIEFIKDKNQFRRVDLGALSIYDSPITEWALNDKRYIVIGSDNYSFALLDPCTLAYRIYSKDGYQNNLIPSRLITNFFIDRQNILWCATANGLSYVTPSSTFYDVIPIYPQSGKKYDATLASKNVYTLLQDESGNWLSTSHDGGIYRFDSNWHLKKHMESLLKPARTDVNKMVFYMGREGSEIFCTTQTGIFAIDTANYHIRSFYPDDEKFAPQLRNIIPISRDLWWVRTHTSGLYVFDVSKGKFIKHYKHTEGCTNCLPDARPEGFLRTRDSSIYITTEDGLYQYRKATDDFIAYKRDEKDSLTFPTNSMDGFALDSSQRLWIGTDKGICVFNTITNKVEKLFPENNIMGYVFRVCIDNYQNVWFNSYSGNWCWLRKKDRLIHLIDDEGFPKNDGTGLFMNGNDGCLYNGCMDALVKYYPKKLMDLIKPSPIPIAVSEISINNKLHPFDVNKRNEKSVTLSPAQNSFTVDFAVLNYDRIKNNKYYYRLLPSGKQWQQNDNGHLSFYDLPPGNYRLEVKGGNEWTGDFPGIDFLLITVQPHWWQTWLFKLFCAIAAGAIIFLVVRKRIVSIRKEADILQQQATLKQKIAETEMQALRAQMNPHFVFNSLNSIENFMMKNDKRMASEYFSKFASLIRMILDNSRNELVPFSKDMEALQLYIELEQLRFDNKFSYQAIIEPALLNEDYNVPPLLIQPFVENAIIHGLSQSDKEKLRILVTAVVEGDYIIYTVQDNGIGRQRSQEYNQQKKKHTSLGISITQERIDILNQQQKDKGKFTITDLYDENGEPDGTRVEVKFKAI